LWSAGLTLTRSGGRLPGATWLALRRRHTVDAVEQRLYEWGCEAQPTAGGTRPNRAGTPCFVPLWRSVVGRGGQRWRGRGTAGVAPGGTLVAWWGVGSTAPWLLLSDRAPAGGAAAWEGVRGWGEQGVKCVQRGGSAVEVGPPPAGMEGLALRPLLGSTVAPPGPHAASGCGAGAGGGA
jgi:hypothetical protein